MTASTAQTVFEPLGDRDAVLATMKQINSVISRLTAAKKPGSTSPPDPRARYQEASIALRRLRAYTGDLLDIRKRMEIEKGALIYVAFLNEAGDYDLALQQLGESKAAVDKLYPAAMRAAAPPSSTDDLAEELANLTINAETAQPLDQATSSTSRALALLDCQLPAHDKRWTPDLLNHILLSQHHALTASLGQLSTNGSPSSPAQWRALLEQLKQGAGPLALARDVSPQLVMEDSTSRKMDAAMSGIFSTIMRHLGPSNPPRSADEATDPPAEALFGLRIYALECLMRSRTFLNPQDAEAEPRTAMPAEDTLAVHLHRATLAYCKALVTNGVPETQLASVIGEAVAGVLGRVQEVLPSRSMRGESKMRTYLEWLEQIASKGAHATLLGAVARMLRSEAKIEDDEPVGETGQVTAEEVQKKISVLCRKLGAETVLCEKWIKRAGADAYDSTVLEGTLDALQAVLRAQSATSIEDAQQQKLALPLERLHFYLARALRSSAFSAAPQANGMLADLLSRAARVVEDSLVFTQGQPISTLPSAALDSLLLLARKTLLPDDPSSAPRALACLARAQAFLATLNSRPDFAELKRAVSSTAFNLGGTLYNAEKYAAAIPFLALACELADGSTPASSAASLDNSPASTQLPKRWELLGLAHLQVREKKEAADAFGQALACAAAPPASVEGIAQDASFTKILSRYTKLRLFDLLQSPQDAAVSSLFPGVGSSARARLLELQIQCLDSHTSKPEAVAAMQSWLTLAENFHRDAGDAAGENVQALAGVLLRQMELSATLTGSLSSEALANKAVEIGRLMGGKDSEDRKAAATMQGFSKIWLAFDAVRLKQNGCSKTLAKEAKEALKLLIDAQPITGPSVDASLTASASTSSLKPRTLTSAAQPVTATGCRTARTTRKTLTSAAAAATVSKKPAVASHTVARKPLSPKNATQPGVARTLNSTTPPKKLPKSPSANGLLGSGSPKAIAAVSRPAQPGFENAPRALSTLSALASLLGAFGHTFLRLSCLKLIRHLQDARSDEEYVKVSTLLGYEYQQLGKWTRAEAVLANAEKRSQNSGVSTRTRLACLLRQADLTSIRGKPEKGLSLYRSALALAEKDDKDECASGSSARITARSHFLFRVANAALVCSGIQFRNGYLADAITSAAQAIRLSNRALANLARLTASRRSVPSQTGARSSVFDKDASPVDTPPIPPVEKAGDAISAGVASVEDQGIGWDVSSMLSDALLWISHLYFTRGSPRPASYFLAQAVELATHLGAPRLLAKIVTKQIDLHLSLKDSTAMHESLALLTKLASEDGGLSTIEIKRIKAHLAVQETAFEDAETGYTGAVTALQKLNKAYADTEGQLSSPPKPGYQPRASLSSSRSAACAVEAILPAMQSQILQSHVSLLCLVERSEHTPLLLQSIAQLALSGFEQAEEAVLNAKVKLVAGMASLRRDPIMGLLQDSVLSVPCLGAMSVGSRSPTRQEALAFLAEIELRLMEAASSSGNGLTTFRWKEVCISIASLRILQSVLGGGVSVPSTEVAAALDGNASLALRREMLECINIKVSHGIMPDDLQWPGSASKARTAAGASLAQYWHALQVRYSAGLSQGMPSVGSFTTSLPLDWAVLSLHLSLDHLSIIAVRYAHGRQPIVMQLPLDRLGKREGEDHLLSCDLARGEMLEIIRGSNTTSQQAKDITSVEGRRAWWKERKDLETRLATLLVNIDERWFGAFRSILTRSTSQPFASKAADTFQTQLNQVLRKAILTTRDNKTVQVQLDAHVMECFLALTNATTDDDLEDLFHFVLDTYQFCGVRIAPDEIDVDQAVVDLRAALDEYLQAAHPLASGDDDHLFLVLDKSLHLFPWESLPSMQSRSISRLPSLSFLQDRLELRKHLATDTNYPGIIIDPRSTYYALNPGGDLKHTQNEFGSWLASQGWSGIAGRRPMEEELKGALASHDLFLYFGHGGAEQYIRSQTIRNLPKCATALLWGCSSGHLKEQGDFEETGIPWTYMLSGSPAVVANLWDVTDKDIDRLTKSTFEHFGLGSGQVNKKSLPAAVAAARGECTLRYLNGAAPVVFGIPVRLLSR